jgi:D-glycero-D-manno-heptose 1,7-bisphosphate phosphatase
MKKAIFLDRDGVINENVSDLAKPEQFKLIPDVPDAIKRINASGYLAVVVTNQPGIAKGFCSFKDMEKIHDKMNRLLKEKGAHIDALYMCPHHPEKGHLGEIEGLKTDCECRKPKPGLILRAAKDLGIDLHASWMIGDSFTDILAGKSAGTKTILLSNGGGCGSMEEKGLAGVKPDYLCEDLSHALNVILSNK